MRTQPFGRIDYPDRPYHESETGDGPVKFGASLWVTGSHDGRSLLIQSSNGAHIVVRPNSVKCVEVEIPR